MNTNNSLRQFVKDGLVGIVVALLIYGILIWLFMDPDFSSNIDKEDTVFGLIFALEYRHLLVSLILAAFFSVGIGGRSLETIPSRMHWIVRILPVIGASWLIGFVLSIYEIITSGVDVVDLIDALLYDFFSAIMLYGAVIGFLIGSVAGIIFNPHKRSNRIIIVATASAFANSGLLFGFVIIIIGQWYLN